nr:cation diffusion facilitator family transporter [Ruegeria faecimaris]
MPISIAVVALKLLAWLLTGSVALLSDAMESTVNVVAALLAYFAVRVANKPPDENHPFSHKKAEYLSAVVEGVLIVLAAFLIIGEAVLALPNPHLEDAPLFGTAVSVIATGVNGAWAYLLLKIGSREGSPALEASSRHIFTDVMTSVGVIAGLILALVTGWLILDPILTILVALNILWEGWKVIRASVDGLIDVTLSDHDLQTVTNAIEANLGAALEYHDLKGRRSANVIFVEFHLVVDGTMPVSAAHDICNDIKEELDRLYPGSVFVIHLEPDDELKGDRVSSR